MIRWLDNDVPYSCEFDDTYFSKSNGQAETSHVYIGGNNLPQRWPQLSQCTIGELGFGSGLNFLETVRQWQKSKPSGGQLTFVSFEQFPLSPDEILRILAPWKNLQNHAQRLHEIWQQRQGDIDINFADDIRLEVIIGDANERLSSGSTKFHAWYLDGFSPVKNPQLWNETLMQDVYYATQNGGTFATYTVAGMARRNLQSVGFNISRKAGFATKREMLVGYKPSNSEI